MDMVIHSGKIPAIGETVLGSEFMMVPGGKGANQAVAAARLGGDVSMIGCVGGDVFGRELINNLTVNGVNAEHVRVEDGISTGVAMITVKDGDNSIIVAPEANSKLSPDKIGSLEDTIKQASILVLQLEIPLKTVRAAIELANTHGVKVLLNPAPAVPLSVDWLGKADILTPNESECEIITGLPVKNVDQAKAAAAYLLNMGVKQVFITLGHNGVVYNCGSDILHKPVHSVEAVDTTAAGDSFTGAIAHALAEGQDIEAAVEFAMIVGALTVTKRGAQTSLPFKADVIDFKQRRGAPPRS